jgi:hypothetical protein
MSLPVRAAEFGPVPGERQKQKKQPRSHHGSGIIREVFSRNSHKKTMRIPMDLPHRKMRLEVAVTA